MQTYVTKVFRLRGCENRVLKRTFGPTKEEVAGGWRRLHMIKSRRMRWAWYVAHMGVMRNAYKILVGKAEGKRPLRRPRHRWKEIRMDLGEIWWQGVEWIQLAQDKGFQWALVNTAMNL
jgi:hypothetical protein